MSETRRKTTAQLVAGLAIKIAVIAAAIAVILCFVLGVTIQHGNSMYPAVRDGDLVISLRLQAPAINSAVLYTHDGQTRVGRVVALEGHTVDISDAGVLTVNGIIPSEEVFYPTMPAEGSSVTYPYTVGPHQVFILNDFRSDADDSRTFGAIDENDVMGSLLLTVRRRGF